jgi:signal transduction histidine kinase
MSSCTTKGTANEKGSGLGLIITKELIEIAGGTLTINSKVNAGTSVLLTFA